jgi:hypothetical protein
LTVKLSRETVKPIRRLWRVEKLEGGNDQMSWLAEVEARKKKAPAAVPVEPSDPWMLPLGRLRGKTGDDGVERLTTQAVLDALEIPQCQRRAGTYRRLSKLMTELGWTAVRVRGMTRGGYIEQVRGYCRDARNRHTPVAGGSMISLPR